MDNVEIPSKLLVDLTMNDRRSNFFYDAELIMKEKLVTFGELGTFFKQRVDPEEKWTHIQLPRSEFNDSETAVIWEINSWRQSYARIKQMKAKSDRLREVSSLARQKIEELRKKISKELGYCLDEKQQYQLAEQIALKKDTLRAEMFGVDVSSLPEEVKTLSFVGSYYEQK